MAIRNVALLVLGCSACLAATPPASAVCAAPFRIESFQSVFLYSYVRTPGIEPGAGFGGSTISPAFDGFFWAVGHADAAVGSGADSGAFPALDWLAIYAGYSAYIRTTWASSSQIDGCISVPPPPYLQRRTMGMFLIDELPHGPGAFALLRSVADLNGDYYFNQGGNATIELFPLPPLLIVQSGETGTAGEMPVVVRGPTKASLLGGVYGNVDDAKRYRVYSKTVDAGGEAPISFQRSAWDDTGVEGAIDETVVVRVPCGNGQALFLSYALIVEGNYVAPILAQQSTRIECTPNLADPFPRSRIAPLGRGGRDRAERRSASDPAP